MRRRLRRRPAPRKVLTPNTAIWKALGSSRLGGFACSSASAWFHRVPLGKAVIIMGSARKAVFVLVPAGDPPSLRFGHPDVTFGRYRLSSLGVAGYRAGAAAFSGCALRVSARTLSVAKQGGAERPGDGCPCVGAEEICGAPPPLVGGKRNEDERRPSRIRPLPFPDPKSVIRRY